MHLNALNRLNIYFLSVFKFFSVAILALESGRFSQPHHFLDIFGIYIRQISRGVQMLGFSSCRR